MKWINKSSVAGFILGAIISPLLIVVGLYLYVGLQMSGGNDYGLTPPELPVEKEVSLDWHVQKLDGTRLNLSNEVDDEVLFLNFWATWCPPCIAEMPSIESLYNQFKGRVKFACISKEQPATIERFRKKHGYSFPMYHLAGNLPKELDTEGIPATFIISPAGRIELKHVGSADWSHKRVVYYLKGFLPD